MADLLQLLVVGVATGCIYALVALGFIIVSETTRIVNFATGELVMIGAFLGVLAIDRIHMPFLLAYPAVLAGMVVIGIIFYFMTFRLLQDHSPIVTIVGTVGISIALQNVALVIWGPLPYRPASPFPETTQVGGAVISEHHIFAVLVTILLVAVLYYIVYRTPFGYKMRAVAQDRDAAQLMGISVTGMFILAWALAFGLAAMAGLLVGPIWLVDTTMGLHIALKAFAAAIIGGFGSLHGAVIGGIIVGLTEILGAAYISSAYKDAIVFAVMILFLVLRPQGILGERIAERG